MRPNALARLAIAALVTVTLILAPSARARSQECDPLMLPGCPFALGSSRLGSLTKPGDIHVYLIQVPVAGTLRIWLTNRSHIGLGLRVQSPTGEIVTGFDAEKSESPETTVDVTEPGQYWVSVAMSVTRREIEAGLGTLAYQLGIYASRPIMDAAATAGERVVAAPLERTYNVGFTPDGSQIVASTAPLGVALWTVGGDGPPRTVAPGAANPKVSPDGRLLATSILDGGRGAIQVWRIADGGLLWTSPPQEKWVVDLAWSPDGETVASTASQDDNSIGGRIRFWRAAAGEQTFSIDTERWDTPEALAFSPDGRLIAVGLGPDTATKRVLLIDVAKRQVVGALESERGRFAISGVAFSPDGTVLAATSNPRVYLWRLADGALIGKLEHGQDARGLASPAFSPDGLHLATGHGLSLISAGGFVHVWRVGDGTRVQTFTGHTWRVTGVAYAPDGQHLASSSLDGTIRLWTLP